MVSQPWATHSGNHSTSLQTLQGLGGEEPKPCVYSREAVPVFVCDIPPAPELKSMQTDFYACDKETSVSMPNITFCFQFKCLFWGQGTHTKSPSPGESCPVRHRKGVCVWVTETKAEVVPSEMSSSESPHLGTTWSCVVAVIAKSNPVPSVRGLF